MRKLFTQLFSILLLNMVFVLNSIGVPVGFPALNPGDDFSNHKKANALVLTATEKVVPGTGVIRLKNGSGATLAAYQASSSNVSITANTGGTYSIAVNFSSFLAEEQQYTLEADVNFVKADDNGEASSAGSWTITEGDWTAPVLATTGALTPANGAVSVQLTDNLVIKFNEAVQLAAGAELYIYKDNGTAHGDLFAVVTSVSGGGTNTLTIDPSVDFAELTKYYVTIPAGAIVDYNTAPYTDNQNKFAGWLGTTNWAFTTRDASAPTIVSISADNIGATSFDVFTKLNEKGKVYVMAVANNASAPVIGDFIAGNGMKVAEVTDPATSVKVSLTQFFNGTTGATLATGVDYDVYVYTETKDAPVVVGTIAKKLDVKTADVVAPTVSALYPANGELAADVNTKDKIYLLASEDIKIGTGAVEVYTWSASLNHTLLVSVPAASCVVKNHATNPDTLYIPVDKTLWASATAYFVKYNEGIVTDLAGNKLAGKTTTEDWKFTVKDYLKPTYTVVPANGATNANNVAPQITITFNENVYADNAGTAFDATTVLAGVSLKKGTNAVTLTLNSFNGKVLKLNIDPAAVASSASFELSIDTKKYFDLAGNVGTTVDKVNFTLKDYEGPVITSVKPATLAPADNITINFNEAVVKTDGTALTNADVANIVVFRKGTDATGALVSAAYSVSADAKSFVIDPTNDFTTPGDQYFVRVGSGSLKDAAGNLNTGKDTVLTVKDFIAPIATISGIGTSPVDPSSVAPVITFSEAMETLAGTPVSGDASALVNLKEGTQNIAFTATWDVSSPAAPKIVVSATFNPSKTYTLSIGKSLQDEADNLFQGISTTFTTWANNAPVMVSVLPVNNAKEQANDAVLKVTFDQPIVAGTGTVSFSGTSASVTGTTISGADLTIAHTTFSTDETITVTVPAGYVKGLNGIGSASPVAWTFKTHETVKPTVVTYSPAIAATGVALDTKLLLTFSENIVKKVGNINIRDYATHVIVQSLSESNSVVKNSNQLEVTLPSALAYNKQYYVEIAAGLVEDVNGNKYDGITGNSWNFTTTANPGAFTVSSSVPADGADKVAAGINPITVTFNRDIKTGSASASAKVTLKNETDNLVVISDAANTSRFSYSGAVMSINTAINSGDVLANKWYTLTLDGGIVTDNWNTASTAKVITFYTYDNNGPKVTTTVPANNATNVNAGTTIVINWDETPLMLDGTAITAAKIKSTPLVTVNGGNAFTASVNGNQWTITMDAPLAENTTVPVVVKQTAVKDANNKTQGADYNFSFTTADVTCAPPSNFSNPLVENTKGTEIKFTVDFSEKGKVYYKILDASATAPTATDLIATGTVIDFAAAGTSAIKTVTGLTSAASYKAYFVAVDASANANQSTVYAPTAFTTKDVVAPVVTAMVPANGAIDVAANTTLKLTFNETVTLGSGVVVIRDVATDVVVETINLGAGNTALVTTSGKTTATITRAVDLSSKTSYYVEISQGAFVDAALNAWAGISGASGWSFTTKDTVAPLLVKTVPAYTAASPIIVKGSTLSIEFNEAMKKPATGTIYVKYVSDDNVFEVVNAASLTQSADLKTFTFGMVNVPVEQVAFWVDLNSITFTDLADNVWDNSPIMGVEGDVWDFIIKDQTPPVMSAQISKDEINYVNANNATGVWIGTDIKIYFNEGVYKNATPTKIDSTLFVIKDPAGVYVPFEISYPQGQLGATEVVLNPKANLISESTYKVYVSPVVDILNNVTSENIITFTTKDNTAPKATAWSPAYHTQCNPKTGVVTVTFSEPVYDEVNLSTSENNPVVVEVTPENIPSFFTYNAGTATLDSNNKVTSFVSGAAVTFTGAISADRKVFTLTPSAALAVSEGWYKVKLLAGKVEDIADNANTADSTIFRIEDMVKPTAVALAPVGGTVKDAAMTITFSEKVNIGAGNIYVRNYVNGEVIETIAVSAATITLNTAGTLATIKHADFPANTNFYVTADAGTFTDASCKLNPWNGIPTANINDWKFSTADGAKPTVTELYPVPGTINVAMNTRLEMTFDKEIQLGDNTHYVVIYNQDWTPFQTIQVNSTNVQIKPITSPVYSANRIVSILHNEFEPNSKYYVRVMAGSIKDKATVPNEYAGLMDDSWYFTTEDGGAPVVTSLTPADNSTNVAITTNLSIVFDRNVLANAAGKVKLYKEMGPNQLGTLIETIDPTSASVTVSEATVTIDLASNLEHNTGYYVIVESGAFTNTSSNKLPFAGIITTLGWNFTTGGDMEAPVLVTWTPNQDTIADNHPTFVMTFNEDVKLTTTGGNLVVKEVGGTVALVTVPLTSAMISGKVITVTYDAAVNGALDKNKNYFVNVDAGAIEDLLGNDFGGVTGSTAWTFRTGPVFATPVKPELGNAFKVYPNPFNERILIDNSEKLSRVVISNIAGQRVIDIQYPTREIRTANLVSGIYVISLFTEDGIVKSDRMIKR